MEVDKKKIIREAMDAYEKEVQIAIDELIYTYRNLTDEEFFLHAKTIEETFLDEKHKKILNWVGGLVDYGLKLAEKDEDSNLWDQSDFTEDEIRDFIIKYAQDKYPEEFMKLKLEKDEKDKKFYEENEKKFEEIKKKREPSKIEELLYLGSGSLYETISLGDLDEEEFSMFIGKFNRYYFIREFLQTLIEYYSILEDMTRFGISRGIEAPKRIDTQFSVLPYLYKHRNDLEKDYEEFFRKIIVLPLNIEKIIANRYSPKNIKRIIEEGEGDMVEFKSTLRINLHTRKIDTETENLALKTIVAFINTNGGILIIGVEDNKNILGIDNYEELENEDKYKRHLFDIMEERIDTKYKTLVMPQFREIDNKRVLVIDCKSNPYKTPATLKEGKSYNIYVRIGGSSKIISPSEYFEFIDSKK